jgi:tRNA pseudouridine38-40 synthase
MRLALGVEYDGSGFHGWQSQPRAKTIQSTLEIALTRIANEPIHIICAGRTDAKVHATHQVIHFDTQANRKLVAWIAGTNSHLPHSISVQWAAQVESDFHARFSALSRRYHYVIYNYPIRSSLYNSFTNWVREELEVQKMQVAAQSLLGEHDFTSFRSAECQSKSPMRHVFAIDVIRLKRFIIVEIIANSFLHHMVRNIVGALLEIGLGRKPVDWCQELLVAKNRTAASKTALPSGLYLTGVRYADSYQLPVYSSNPISG